MSGIDVIISKKNIAPELTSNNINYLRTKIIELGEFYNIMFKHMCYKKNLSSSHDVFANVKAELTTKYPNYLKDYCLGDNPGMLVPGTGNCTNPMFDDNKLRSLIASMTDDRFLNKACLYRDTTGKYSVNVQVQNGGHNGYNPNFNPLTSLNNEFDRRYLNIVDILKEEPPKETATILCIKINDKIRCAEMNSKKSCSHCDKWSRERNMFRSVLKDLITTKDINQIFELMSASVHLLPAAILNQEQYHAFYSAIEQIKKSKRLN